MRTCLVTQLDAFLNMCPIHFQRFFPISSSAGVVIVSGQRIRSILRRQLLINTCIFLVVLQVSAPYSRTVLTFVLKILTLVSVDSCVEFQMFFICKYAAQICKGFYIFQIFSVNCDWIGACCVVSANFAFPFVYVETYCC
ncbi:unnamed protein product [Schistosoma mattheei]|uniref:Uncharacterized protein n=1 Tax=Schistosoma mattheei TaxID=31246 RepID=A0A183PE03_9TREM|nr:unnamed protein product [Schistosoma mattheei]